MKKLKIMTPHAASSAAANAGPVDFLSLMPVIVLLLHNLEKDRAEDDKAETRSPSTHDSPDEPSGFASSQERPAVILSCLWNGGRLGVRGGSGSRQFGNGF